MRIRLIFLIFLSFAFSHFLFAQIYEDGFSKYKAANTARLMGDRKGEQEKLDAAFKIFESNAKNDNRALIMYYLLSLKSGKYFPLNDLLDLYVKSEHKDFSTVDQIKFFGDDRTLILSKLKELAVTNETKAKTFLENAKELAKKEEYLLALDKLDECEKLWNLDEVKPLKGKYSQKKQEKELATASQKIQDLKNQGLFSDALDSLSMNKGLFSNEVYNSTKTDIKKKWAEGVLRDAKQKFQQKKYDDCILLCENSYQIYSLNEAPELKKKAERKKRKANDIKPKAGFSIFADYGRGAKNNLAKLDFSWEGNSNEYASITDSGTIKALPSDEQKFRYTYTLGMSRMFSPSVGIMASVSLFDQQMSVITDYTFSWKWWDGSGGSRNSTMIDDVKVSIKPVCLNLLLVSDMKNGAVLKFYVGPTLFLTDIDLKTRIGYGGVWSIKGKGIYAEWFPFEYVIKGNKILWGGNAGLDMEYKFSSFASFYLGIQYLGQLPASVELKLVEKGYKGQMWNGDIVVGNAGDLPNLPNYKIKIDSSFYKAFLGMRFFL